MKHSFKRLLSMVLALAMVLSCVPVQAFAEECAHEYDIVITGPSCTEPGSMVYTCGLCGDTYEEEGEEPSGHDYAVDEVPATCLEDGLVTYVCTVCGESETEEIDAPGHCYVDGACEVCGEADPEAKEPVEEPAEEPAEEPEDAFVQETIAPVDADADPSQPTEDGGEMEMPDEPVGDAVAKLGKDGKTFTTLEAAIETAAAIDIDERPFVSLLTDYTVNETIVIDEVINISYIGGDGKNPIVTAAEGVDTLFEITEKGELLLNDIDIVTPGDYIINITGDNATFMAVNCNLNGGSKAAINVADDVNWYYPPTDQWFPITVQVYNSTVGGRTALHLGGSNATATFAPGQDPNGRVELTGDSPDGVIVIDGDGHEVQMYETAIETNAGNHTAFTMKGDSVIKFGGVTFNGTDYSNPWDKPMPQNGAVARLDIGYYGSLNSALDAANSGGYNSPLDILAPVTITDDVELNYAPIAVRNVLTVDGGALKVNSPDLCISEEGTLKVIGGTLELNSNSMTTIQGKVILDTNSELTVEGSHLMEVGSGGTLTVANSDNVNLAAGDSIRVFLPGGTANGIDGLWGTYLVEEASEMQTAVDAFVENGDYVNYGIKEIAPYYSMTLTDHITIADDVRLLLYPWEGNPVILTVPAGVTLTNNGEIYAGRDCHIVGGGDIDGNGTIIEEGVTLEDLQSVIYEAYRHGEREVWLHENAILAGALWIPEELQVFAENVTITVPQGKNLNLAGSGMNLLGTEMNVLGTLNTYAPLYVNDDSYLHIAGKGALTMESNSVVTIQGNMSLDTEATLSLSENAKIEVGSHGNLTAETDTEITSEGAIWVFLPGGTTTNIPKNAMEGVIYDPEDLDEALTTAATYRDQYSSVRLEIWDRIIHVDDEITIPENVVLALNNSGNGYYEELIIPEGQKLVNNGTIVVNAETALRNFGKLENNGTIILELWGSMVNYGTITDNGEIMYNGGDYAEGDMSQSALEEALANMSENVGGWIHESVTELSENMTIELGIRESDGAERTFRVAKYGQIIVPRDVTLTLNSPVSLEGGQIIVENGGKLVVNRQLHIGSGTLYMENGAHLDVQNGGGRGILVTWENDDKPDHITAYNIMENWLDDRNSELYETIDHWDHGFHRESQILPGYGNHLIFYFNHWNDEDKIWERTPIHPDDMTVTRGLEIYSLKEDQGYQIQPGQRNGDCFVSVQVPYDESLWDTVQKIKHGGCEYLINVKRDERAGFYSEPVASNETYLTDIAFGPGMSNTFYYIVTDENHPVTDIEVTLEAGPEIVENGVQFFKYADKVWLMKLSDEAAEKMDRNYWLSVKLKYPDGNGGFRGEGGGGINCFPYVWMRGMPDATIELNNQEYRYYYATDEWVAGCWVEDDNLPEGGFWSEYNTELPEGVSYDYDSNTLTLNGANLNYLGVGYHWSNGNEEGYNLPNPDLTIEVLGENEIGGGQSAFDIRGGANVAIVGDGSLTIWNNNEHETLYSLNAVNVEDSTLTIGGSVNITMAVSGQNWWENGEPATMHAIQGGETSDLIITDSATVNIHVPDLRGNEADEDGGFEYRGLANFANITVEKRATVNLDTLHLKDGQTFIQNGGTVNIDDPGTIIYMDDQGNTRKVYEPVVIREGSRMLITGGTMNLTLDDTDTNARGAIIKVENDSELQISGGQITINNNVKAPGIYVSGDSRLFFIGGTMYYNGTMFEDGERTAFINVDGQANFTGGTIRVENGVFNFYGWNENAPMIQWMGTNLIAKNTVIEQNGSFRMTGGKMQLTNSRFHANGNTVFAGGTMDMDNSVLIGNGYTGVEGVAMLDFDIDDGFYKAGFPDNCAIEVNSYFPIEGFAKINIDADLDECISNRFFGIRLSTHKNEKGEVIVGGYHQMGGTVSINSNANAPAINSWGSIMLNAGTMNLNAVGGISIANNGATNEDEKNFFDMWEGFSLNVDAAEMGLELRTNSSIQGGNLNVKATGEGGVGVYVSGDSELEISGGNHVIQANHIGIMADHGTVKVTEVPSETDVIEKPEINVEAGYAALYSRMEADENRIEFAEDSIFDKDANATASQWVQEQRAGDNCFRYGLSSDGENFAKSIRFNKAPMTLQEALAAMGDDDYVVDDDKNHRYQLKQAVIVEERMELDRVLDVLDGGKITVRNGATLTIPDGSAHLIAKKNGAVIVEAGGKIVNGGIMAADGGVIIVNSNGYEHMDGAILNSHFHEEPDGEGGYRLDLDSVRGIPEIYVNLDGTVDTTDGLRTVLEKAEKGYAWVKIWTPNDMCLDGMCIPYNTDVWIDSQDETPAEVTLNPGQELTIEGALNLGNADFTVAGDLFSVGSIQTDIKDAAKITVTGKIYNQGEIGLNNAELNVDGNMDNVGFMVVNNDSVVKVNGMLVDYGYLWVGNEGNGTVNVAGELNVHQNMTVYENGTVNVNEDAVLRVCNYYDDGMSYDYSHLDVYGTVNVAGALENSNALDLYGTVNVAEGGTLINDGEVCMWGDEPQSGAKLMVAGTFVNNVALYNASCGGIVDATEGDFINREANPDDPYDYDAEILTRYFEDGSIAEMKGINNGIVILTYEGASTTAAKAMAKHAKDNGYATSLFRVDGAALVAAGEQLTVNTIVMLSGSQLGVNGGLTVNDLLRQRPESTMAIGSVGVVNIIGGLRVDPADYDNDLPAAVLNNKGILECGAYGFLDICGEYNDSGVGNIYTNIVYDYDQEGYNQSGVWGDAWNIYQDAQVLVGSVDNEEQMRHVIDMVEADGYRSGIIRIDSEVTVHEELYIPGNVTVEIYTGCLNMEEGTLINDGTVKVNGLHAGVTRVNGTFGGTGTYSGHCGENTTWSVKNGILTISGRGEMGDFFEDPSPWGDFNKVVSKIVLDKTVTNIGVGAFANFDAVLTIPETVTSIGGASTGNCTLKIYHGSYADTYVKDKHFDESKILYFHVIDPESGECTYTECGYSIYTVLDSTAKPEEKIEEIKSIDAETLKGAMEKAESDPENDLVDQLDQLEQEVKNVTGLDVGIKHSEDVSEEIADAFSNVSEDAAIIGAVLNAEEGVEEVNLVIGDPETTLDEEETRDYNMDASVHFSMTMEGVGNASQLDVPVKITLPIPDSIFDLAKLVVKHFHAGGEDDLTNSCVVTVDEDGKAYVSFFVTGFSDFLLAQRATPITLTARINHNTVTEGTNPDDIFISVTAREKATNKTVSGLSTNYIIRDAEGNEVELEEALAKAGTYTVEPHCLVLDAQYVIMEDADVVTATLTVEPEKYDYVCQNTTTGTKYEIVQIALAEAKNGETILMLTDSDETKNLPYLRSLDIDKGVTLDLNGKALKVNKVIGYNGSNVVDPKRGGLLDVSEMDDVVLSVSNSEMAVWNGDGYIFGVLRPNITSSGNGLTKTDNLLEYRFTFTMSGVLQSYLKNSEDGNNGVTALIRLSWNTYNEDGSLKSVAYQNYTYSLKEFCTVANGGYKFLFTLANYASLRGLTIGAYVVSDTGTEACVSIHTIT